jgi:hypothetical protein
MAIVRHFAINLVRLGKGHRSIKTTRKLAGWKTAELARLLSPLPVNLDSVPWPASSGHCHAAGAPASSPAGGSLNEIRHFL